MAVASILLAALLQTGATAPPPSTPSAQTIKNLAFMLDHYPPGALKRGEQGRVGVRVSTTREGRVRDCQAIESSGFHRLDAATCDMLVRFGRFEPLRNERGNPIQATQDGFVDWRLPPGIAPSAPPTKVNARLAAVDKEKIVCKSTPKLGSLFITQRRCLTVREWRLAELAAKRLTSNMQDAVPF